MSIHKAEVVRISEIKSHPNADKLGIVNVLGFQACVRLGDFKPGDLAIYVEPDSIVPDTEPFQFLKSSSSKHWNRIRVKRLRGAISMGLLIKAPEGSKEGDDLMGDLGITHYEPPLPMSTGGDNEKGPSGWYPKYDVENFRRFNTVLKEGEEVVVTEKLHGSSAKFKYTEDRIWCGSRTNWKKEDEKNLWWQALRQNPWIEEWCKRHQDLVLYGEVFGMVQSLRYGSKQNEIRFAAFDIFNNGTWLDFVDAELTSVNVAGFQWVPLLYHGPFNEKIILELAEGNSSIEGADHCREGVVVKTVIERQDIELGRVQLKVVSSRYLEKNY